MHDRVNHVVDREEVDTSCQEEEPMPIVQSVEYRMVLHEWSLQREEGKLLDPAIPTVEEENRDNTIQNRLDPSFLNNMPIPIEHHRDSDDKEKNRKTDDLEIHERNG